MVVPTSFPSSVRHDVNDVHPDFPQEVLHFHTTQTVRCSSHIWPRACVIKVILQQAKASEYCIRRIISIPSSIFLIR